MHVALVGLFWAPVVQFDGHSAVFFPPAVGGLTGGSMSVAQCIRATIRSTDPLAGASEPSIRTDVDPVEEVARRAWAL